MGDTETNIPLTSVPPQKALEMIVAELRHPISSIEGWAMILAAPEMKAQHGEAVDNILKWCQGVRNILEVAQAYLAERNP